MSRTFTAFAEQDPAASVLVGELPLLKGNAAAYGRKMREIGVHLADSIVAQLGAEHLNDICVICTVEDADFLARGIIETLESCRPEADVRMICLWNQRIDSDCISIAPVIRSYEEPFDKNDAIFIVVKSIIASACVVKTNLTRAISFANPKRVIVAAPVMLAGAEQRLASEFPADIAAKFEFVHFATDTEQSTDGKEVVPGIGGSVYELLGLGDENTKNKYVPDIVRERRRKAFPSLLPA